jgi:hypothetical protein
MNAVEHVHLPSSSFSTIYISKASKSVHPKRNYSNKSFEMQTERESRKGDKRRRDIENDETMFGYKGRCIQEISLNSRDLDK